MKPTLSDQLKDFKLDFSDYGRLPIREDVIVFDASDAEKNKSIMKLWERLNYLRKHLKIIDRYIQHNKGETLIEWLQQTNQALSEKVLKEIGNYNNETGGISAYFLNLQDFYDKQEAMYDDAESKVTIPDDLKNAVNELRPTRLDKRKARSKTRKIKFKDMKKDNKGYFKVEIEEPVAPADGDVKEKLEGIKEKLETEKKMKEVEKKTKSIGIWIAGTLIAVTAIGTFMAIKNER